MGWFDLLKRRRPSRAYQRRPPNPFEGETQPEGQQRRIMGRGIEKPTEKRKFMFEQNKKRIPTKMIAVGAKSGRPSPSRPDSQYYCNMCGKELSVNQRKEISYLKPDGNIRLATLCEK